MVHRDPDDRTVTGIPKCFAVFFCNCHATAPFFSQQKTQKSSSGNIPSSKSSMLDKLGKCLNVRFQLPLGFDVAVVSGFGFFVKPVPGSVGSIGSKF